MSGHHNLRLIQGKIYQRGRLWDWIFQLPKEKYIKCISTKKNDEALKQITNCNLIILPVEIG